MKKPAIVLLFLALVVGICIRWAIAEGPLRDPAEALQDFYEATDRAEDQLIDPLVLNGQRVVPLVLRDLPDKEMPLRRYAIGFLGNGGYEEALPLLVKIVTDESEEYYFRSDALIAIYGISPETARQLAPNHVNGELLLGKYATVIVDGENPVYWTRSWWDAFRSYHH